MMQKFINLINNDPKYISIPIIFMTLVIGIILNLIFFLIYGYFTYTLFIVSEIIIIPIMFSLILLKNINKYVLIFINILLILFIFLMPINVINYLNELSFIDNYLFILNLLIGNIAFFILSFINIMLYYRDILQYFINFFDKIKKD